METKQRPHEAARVGTGRGQQRQRKCTPAALAQWDIWETKNDELHANPGKKQDPISKKEERGGRKGEEGERKEGKEV